MPIEEEQEIVSQANEPAEPPDKQQGKKSM